MGSLVDGVWVEEDNVNSSSGSFVRPESVFRHWVTKDGSPGPHGDGGAMCAAARDNRSAATTNPCAVQCVERPDGFSLGHVHSPHTQVHVWQPEARYCHDFGIAYCRWRR